LSNKPGNNVNDMLINYLLYHITIMPVSLACVLFDRTSRYKTPDLTHKINLIYQNKVAGGDIIIADVRLMTP